MIILNIILNIILFGIGVYSGIKIRGRIEKGWGIPEML